MKFLLFIANILIVLKFTLANDQDLGHVGTVANVMENLAENTAQIVDEVHASLELKVEHTSDALLGSIQVTTTNAMKQLAEAFYAANQKLASCPQPWTMGELQNRIDEQLTNCTLNLVALRTVFAGENASILQGIQNYVTELASISVYCELLGNGNISSTSFASSTACFVQKLAELNRNVGQLIGQANTSLVRTRYMSRSGVESSTKCSIQVVENFTNYLNEAFKNC